jgi:para-nitrobenzyl esterase
MNNTKSQVMTPNGQISGSIDAATGVHSFKGIPFAAAPVGDLRWKAPQPVQPWSGVRKADHFGPRAMQLSIFGDMNFRSDGMSEDCLYLNVWTPDPSTSRNCPYWFTFMAVVLWPGMVPSRAMMVNRWPEEALWH